MKRLAAIFSSLLVASAAILPSSAVFAESSNLIANPGFETAAGADPANWTKDSWGTNTAAFSYDTTGHTGRSASVKVSNYKTGDAKWSFTPVTVTPNTTYTFSDWYKSSVVTGVDAVVTTTTNNTTYIHAGDPAASADWKQYTYSFKAPANAKQVTFYHYVDKNGSLSVDDYNLSTEGSTPPVQPTAPSVSITAPAAAATVSGTQSVTANAATPQGTITSVQFKLDGANLGAADTTAPYAATWDTKTVADGSHSLTAVATNSSSLSTTSSAVAVTVKNTVTPPTPPVVPPTPPTPPTGNLIANPSVETSASNLPTSWVSDSWGTNTHSFTYENTGQDGTHSVKTTVSKYTSGDAKWYFTPVNVTPGKNYVYTEWYKANIASEVDAMVTMTNGSVQYFYLGAPAAASDWTKVSYQFTPPAGAATVTIFHVAAKVGYVQSDNFSFAPYAVTPANQFTRGLVSLTFDDGWRDIYTNGFPLLQKYGLKSTQYLNSQPVVDGYPDYMTYQMVKDWKANGHELSWHTRTHADVTTLSAANLNTELTIPQAFLTGTGTTAADYKNFATPYGAYNPTSVAAIMQKYRSHRSTDVGYNSKDNFDITNIKVQNITSATTPADVQAWVNQAAATKTWLVIVYHEVTTTPEDAEYSVTPANLDSELNIVKQSGLTVKTVDQALDEITTQL